MTSLQLLLSNPNQNDICVHKKTIYHDHMCGITHASRVCASKETFRFKLPRVLWSPLSLPSQPNFHLANREARETSYLCVWQSGWCTLIRLCIWDRPDVRLERGCALLLIKACCQPGSELRWHLQHQECLAVAVGLLAKPLGERRLKGWPVWIIQSAAFSRQRLFCKIGLSKCNVG